MIKATVAVTAMLIWMQLVTALGPSINAMNTIEDSASMIEAIEQQIELADNNEPESNFGELLSSIFSIPGASADFDDGPDNFTPTEKTLDKKLNQIYDQFEKKAGISGLKTTLEKLVDRVDTISKSSSIQSSPSKLALVNFIGDHVQDKLDQLNGTSNNGSSNTIKEPIKQSSSSNETTTSNDTDKEDDIKGAPAATSEIWNSPEFKAFVANGGKAIDLNGVADLEFRGKYGYFGDSQENFKAAQASFKASFPTQDWSKVSLEDAVIPGEVIFNMPREQIQELTQDITRGKVMQDFWMIGTFKMNDNIEVRYTNNGSINLGSEVYNEMKYHFLINWEIEIGSEKYNDFRQDYFADDRVEVRDSGLYVALEPLPLGKTLEQKIENGVTLTSDELIQAWNTALELENLTDRYEIKKALIWSTIGYKVVDNNTGQTEMQWTLEDGSRLGWNFWYTAVTSPSVKSYLFARYNR